MKFDGGTGTGVDIYPVGFLDHLQQFVHAPKSLRRHYRGILLRGGRRHWRQRSYWNGYLCEPRADDASWTRCGHGWTRGRAYDDLQRHLREVSA